MIESNFVGVNRLFVLFYWNQDEDSKSFKTRRCYLPKGIIKNYNVIIDEKNLYGQAIDSDINRYKEIGKLTTGQGKDYTTGCLFGYHCIKNRYRPVADDLKT